eukprot:2187374-Rhodomonas_salina.2
MSGREPRLAGSRTLHRVWMSRPKTWKLGQNSQKPGQDEELSEKEQRTKDAVSEAEVMEPYGGPDFLKSLKTFFDNPKAGKRRSSQVAPALNGKPASPPAEPQNTTSSQERRPEPVEEDEDVSITQQVMEEGLPIMEQIRKLEQMAASRAAPSSPAQAQAAPAESPPAEAEPVEALSTSSSSSPASINAADYADASVDIEGFTQRAAARNATVMSRPPSLLPPAPTSAHLSPRLPSPPALSPLSPPSLPLTPSPNPIPPASRAARGVCRLSDCACGTVSDVRARGPGSWLKCADVAKSRVQLQP